MICFISVGTVRILIMALEEFRVKRFVLALVGVRCALPVFIVHTNAGILHLSAGAGVRLKMQKCLVLNFGGLYEKVFF